MAHPPRIQAVAFDAFGTLFDVYSVGLLAEQLYPGKGAALAELWRSKQIEYSFIRTLSGRYKPFWDITRTACALPPPTGAGTRHGAPQSS
jgi:2-haloacid dehalogenase